MTRFCGAIRRPLVMGLLAGVLAFWAPVAAKGQQGPPIIRAIDVEYSGPPSVSKEWILSQIRTQIGQPYSDQVVEQDIRQLYSTGAVRNVRIFAQPEGDGVKVIVAVQTRAVVREIEIDGAHEISAKTDPEGSRDQAQPPR